MELSPFIFFVEPAVNPKNSDIHHVTYSENSHDSEQSHSNMDRLKSVAKSVCSRKQLYKKLPILTWLPKYDLQTGVSDLIAGVTVGLTVIPQGIAYALVAKLPPQVQIQPK